MRILFFDTETTGLPKKKQSYKDPKHPRIVQLAARLEVGQHVEGEFNILINQPLPIQPGACAVHGITSKMTKESGVSEKLAIELFKTLVLGVDLLVAHNFSFDEKLIRSMCWHATGTELRLPKSFCTMKSTTNLCKLPGRYGYKWPTLDEASRHFLGHPVFNAHDALADVKACAEIFNHLLSKGYILDERGSSHESV